MGGSPSINQKQEYTQHWMVKKRMTVDQKVEII